jgi:hypothetical protein
MAAGRASGERGLSALGQFPQQPAGMVGHDPLYWTQVDWRGRKKIWSYMCWFPLMLVQMAEPTIGVKL